MTHADTMSTLEDVLRIDPDASAVRFSGSWWTYGDLAAAIDVTRQALAGLGSGPSRPVATILPNRPEGLIAMLAVLFERGCIVGISPRRPRLDLASAPTAIATLGPVDLVDQGATVRGSGGLAIASGSSDARCSEGTAVLMATSGTTGDPKRIPISYATLDAVVGGVRTLARSTGAGSTLRDDTTLICFPYTSLSGFLPQLIALVSGRRTALLERFEPHVVAAIVAEHRMTSLALNPTAMRMLLDPDIDPAALATVRYVRSGSAPLTPELAARFEERFDVGVLQSYGQTEVGGEVIGWSSADHRVFGATKRGSVGRPHRGVKVRVVRRDSGPDEPLADGEAGDLWLLGARNVTGWHRTGDLARVDDDGFVWIEGRADGVIICGGFNIVPATLEQVLERHPAVAEAAVVARPDDRLGEVPVAIVALRQGHFCDAAQLLDHCRPLLEPFQLPRAIVLVDALPRNEIGKLYLPSLRQLAGADPSPACGSRGEEPRP